MESEIYAPGPWNPIFLSLENVVISGFAVYRSVMGDDRYKTLIKISGLKQPLWYCGNFRRHNVGDRVSIIYEIIMIHGHKQLWIHLIDSVDVPTLSRRWLDGESCCREEQFY